MCVCVAGDVQNLDREVKKCLLESFKKTDETFLKSAADASPTWKDGYGYSGTSLIRTPMGQKKVSLLVRCPHFRD